MAFTAFRDMKPYSQFMFAAFVILASFLAFMVVSMLVALPFFGLEKVMNMASFHDLENPEHIVILKYFQTVQAIGLFVVPPFILGYLFYGKTNEYLYLHKNIQPSSIFWVLMLMLCVGPFINLMGLLNNNMTFPEWLAGIETWMKDAEENAANITKAFVQVETLPGLAFNLFMIAFLPAIGEELLFRGVIQRIFTNMTRNHQWGIWISAILFSALHVQFYGFVPRVLLGALFGYLLVWSGSMWLPIIGHFFNNAIAVVALYLIHNQIITPKFETYGSDEGSYYAAILSLGLTVAILVLLKKQYAHKALSAPEPETVQPNGNF